MLHTTAVHSHYIFINLTRAHFTHLTGVSGEASRLALEEADELLLHMLTLKQRLIAGLKGRYISP